MLEAARLTVTQHQTVLSNVSREKPADHAAELELTLLELKRLEEMFSMREGNEQKKKAAFDDTTLFTRKGGKDQGKGRGRDAGKGGSWNRVQSAPPAVSGCFTCGSKDHWARDCPQKGKGKGSGGKKGGKKGGKEGEPPKKKSKSKSNYWKCSCGAFVWPQKETCFKCGAKKPGGSGPGGGGK